MATQVKIPGIGPVDKKYVYAGGAVIVVIVGYAYYRSRNASATPTGEEALPDDSTGLEGDVGDTGGGVSDYVNPGGSQPPVSVDTNPNPTTNAEWTRLAIEYLTENGYDSTAVSGALGKYLDRKPLTVAQADIVRVANAVLGSPPVGTFSIIIEAATPTTPVTPPTGNTAIGKPTGLKTWGNGPSRLTVPLKWNKVPNAVGYRVYRAGVAENINHSVDTQTTIGGLKPNTTYKFHVRAIDSAGKTGPASGVLTVKTKK